VKIKFRPKLNHAKILLALIVLIFDLVGAVSSWMGGFYPGVATFILLGLVTLDYIRITRREMKLRPYYILDNIDS